MKLQGLMFGYVVGEPIEEGIAARKKLKAAGFDPDNLDGAFEVSQNYGLEGDKEKGGKINWTVTPMVYFAYEGDLPMCRYLFAHGASTSSRNVQDEWFPLYAAALRGRAEVCKWLYENGAKRDIRRENKDGYTPLSASINDICLNRRDTTRWLILNGALSKGSTSDIDPAAVREDLAPYGSENSDYIDERQQLLFWASEAVLVHSNYRVFLMGTLTAPDFSTESLRNILVAKLHSAEAAQLIIEDASIERQKIIWDKLCSSPVRCLGCHSGVLELISDFVGVRRGKELRIMRQLAEVLYQWI